MGLSCSVADRPAFVSAGEQAGRTSAAGRRGAGGESWDGKAGTERELVSRRAVPRQPPPPGWLGRRLHSFLGMNEAGDSP